MRNPIVVTTLEEDFRKIGLIKESVAPAPAAESSDDDEDLDEARAKKRTVKKAGGGFQVQKLHRQSGIDRIRSRAAARLPGAKETRKQYKKKKAKSSRMQATSARVAAVGRRKGTRQEAVDANETLKSFANAAIIADKLSTIFTEWVKADIYESEDERMFAGLAGELGEIAESFADIATAMSEGKLEESAEDVAAAFAEGMETILDAVDLYEDNNEDEDEDEDEDEVEETSGND
jgi:hypothetical protein